MRKHAFAAFSGWRRNEEVGSTMSFRSLCYEERIQMHDGYHFVLRRARDSDGSRLKELHADLFPIAYPEAYFREVGS